MKMTTIKTKKDFGENEASTGWEAEAKMKFLFFMEKLE